MNELEKLERERAILREALRQATSEIARTFVPKINGEHRVFNAYLEAAENHLIASGKLAPVSTQMPPPASQRKEAP